MFAKVKFVMLQFLIIYNIIKNIFHPKWVYVKRFPRYMYVYVRRYVIKLPDYLNEIPSDLIKNDTRPSSYSTYESYLFWERFVQKYRNSSLNNILNK